MLIRRTLFYKKCLHALAFFMGLLCFSVGVHAQLVKGVTEHVRKGVEQQANRPTLRRPPSPPPAGFYQFDNRHWHDRYYPRAGHVVPHLPDPRIRIEFRNREYFYFGGIWYRPMGLEFEVIAPPIGIFVPVLPPYYTTIWVHNVPYYYANHVYYVWRPSRSSYQVVEEPAGADENDTPLVADELFIYPKEGQTDEKLAEDRYQCHRWSREQTDFDPTEPPTGLSVAELTRKRDDYQRAMRACLEGRGYSVR